MPTDPRTTLGRSGEDATVARYRHLGFDVVARNWRCDLGEIDVVVRHGSLLVFCEVKTRSGARYGGGYEAVTDVKRARLRRLAEVFLLRERPAFDAVRFDVASVLVARGRVDVQLFEDAF